VVDVGQGDDIAIRTNGAVTTVEARVDGQPLDKTSCGP
jgi:hypothetical protein